MPSVAKFISGLALAVATVSAIPHDEVEAFGEDAPSVFKKYQPYLKVNHGCVPFPAVNSAGEVSDGLKNTGSPNGQCGSSDGQIYARGREFPNSFAIMYSWYMPKDQPVAGTTGHRHEWESVIVWLSEESDDAKYLGIAYSGHGGYSTRKSGEGDASGFDGSRPLVGYGTNGILNHELSFPDVKGGEQPLIDWGAMTPAAREALRNHDFRDANVPFNDDNFYNNLKKGSL